MGLPEALGCPGFGGISRSRLFASVAPTLPAAVRSGFLTPLHKYEIWPQPVRQEVPIAEAAQR